uniref:ATP synthase F0 subunit 8 n=1 Tax=Laemobothrion atrum TaxID=179170 RepID=UPI002580E460|nr:ATP synthase F0 subunit 8 [Laemobothrion atrum]WGU50350.1 ATP synthase subunit 8 [Laemobothrion atrum]
MPQLFPSPLLLMVLMLSVMVTLSMVCYAWEGELSLPSHTQKKEGVSDLNCQW